MIEQEKSYHEMVREYMTAKGYSLNTGEHSVNPIAINEVKGMREDLLKVSCEITYAIVWGSIESGLPVSEAVKDYGWDCDKRGMDFYGAFCELHRSNMSKLGDNYTPADMGAFER